MMRDFTYAASSLVCAKVIDYGQDDIGRQGACLSELVHLFDYGGAFVASPRVVFRDQNALRASPRRLVVCNFEADLLAR